MDETNGTTTECEWTCHIVDASFDGDRIVVPESTWKLVFEPKAAYLSAMKELSASLEKELTFDLPVLTTPDGEPSLFPATLSMGPIECSEDELDLPEPPDKVVVPNVILVEFELRHGPS